MRLSGLMIAVVLLVPPTVFAQHSATSSSGSTGSSSHASAPSSGASHASSNASPSHNSTASFSGGSHSGSSHAAPGTSHPAHAGSANSGVGGMKPATAGSPANMQLASARADLQPDLEHSVRQSGSGSSQAKSGETPSKTTQPEKRGLFGFLRHPFQKPEPKTAEVISGDAEHHRRKCKDGPCKEPMQSGPIESDLHHRVCLKGPCPPCPAGEWRGAAGTCAPTTPATLASNQCRAGESWNGSACSANTDRCAAFGGRAAIPEDDVRGARVQMQVACTGDPFGQECGELRQRYDGAVLQYRMLLNEAPPECRALLPDPLAL